MAKQPPAQAVPKPQPESVHADPLAGELVTESLEYDGGRQVTVYVPSDPPEAIVFAGDGQLISQWGGFLEAADVPSTMIVGVHRTADETLRHRGVWCLGGWRARARHWASASGRLQCGLLRVARRRLPTAWRDAEFDSARIPRCRHPGAVFPRQRDPVGGRAARCRCGRRHERAGRVARRRTMARRVPVDGGVGVWPMTHRSV